ncbi:hypothetical protein [Microbulbifer hainanensis]|uniref:hypothetical protein n=1 Tax=Microbulbifer hainanensis TaxID=2735675 RepID=UPI0018665AC0|nr:hypothetical protein [Microbulbifer hainanensis]
MRQFSILVIFVVAFGSAAALYEHESRKVKGVLSQITELQAQLGDLQAEVNRLNGELEAVKLAERRRPSLKAMASQARREAGRAVQPRTDKQVAVQGSGHSRELIASDVTSAPPAIHGQGDDSADDAEWSQPTVDADRYREVTEGDDAEAPITDPYQ